MKILQYQLLNDLYLNVYVHWFLFEGLIKVLFSLDQFDLDVDEQRDVLNEFL